MSNFSIKDGLLFRDGVQVTFKKSPNIGGKKKSKRFIIIHYDGSLNATGAVSWMLSPQSKVSAELWIGRKAELVQLVNFETTAYHAGKSEWKDVVGLNSHSIGIELQNSGSHDYTQEQLSLLADVCKAIEKEYGTEEILGHSDIAPGRKVDPGKQFPMKWLREQVYGDVSTLPAKFTTANVNLRTGAGTNFSVVEVLSKGTEVNILSEDNGWSEVFICSNKKKGFVNSAYIK